jgi:hypothetical protein
MRSRWPNSKPSIGWLMPHATGTKIDDLLDRAMKAGLGPSKLPEPDKG